MLCVKSGSNWPSGFQEDENVKSLQKNEQTDGGQRVVIETHLSLENS